MRAFYFGLEFMNFLENAVYALQLAIASCGMRIDQLPASGMP